MNRTSMVGFMAPLFAVSLLLLGLGGFAAWHTHRQQIGVSELVANDVHAMVLGHDLYIEAREVRHLLNQYLRTDDEACLTRIHVRLDEIARMLASSHELTLDVEQSEKLAQVETGYQDFLDLFKSARALPATQASALLQDLTDRRVSELILDPANDFVQLNETIVERTNARNRQNTRTVMQGLLLLGVCGSVAGVIGGLALARGLQRTLLELHVSVSGTMEKLDTIVGPFPANDFAVGDRLPAAMRELEARVEHVVSQLQAREREVLHNQQLAAMGRLAAALAHEMRNPLTPIKMLVQMAQDRADGSGLDARELAMIEREVSRLEFSIQSFLEFARPPVLEKRANDVCLTVSDAVALVSARCRAQEVDIEVKYGVQSCEINHDAAQIKQVILNLLLNALDELKAQGHLRVAIQPQFAQFETSHAPPPLLGVWLRVADDGPGIAVEEQERIFEPFATTKEGGTGLGLAICRRIVEAHGGRITLSSTPGHGSTFSVWLPSEGVPWRGPTSHPLAEHSSTRSPM